MSKYYPDKWVVLEMVQDDGSKEYKILASWYGGFAGSNSWKLSSGIESTEVNENGYGFLNYSGSTYYCHPNTYGMSSYTSGIYMGWIEELAERIRMMDEAEVKTMFGNPDA